eukprot:Tbor_TRINITY_DN4574_c0_g1::TRINITY_DN4574_c0_g1_i1::g.15874::m.15874
MRPTFQPRGLTSTENRPATSPSKSRRSTSETLHTSNNTQTTNPYRQVARQGGPTLSHGGKRGVSPTVTYPQPRHGPPHRPLSTDAQRESYVGRQTIERIGGERTSGIRPSGQASLDTKGKISTTKTLMGAGSPNINPRTLLNRCPATSDELFQKKQPLQKSVSCNDKGNTITSSHQTLMYKKRPLSYSTPNGVKSPSKATVALQLSQRVRSKGRGEDSDLQHSIPHDVVACNVDVDSKLETLELALREIGVNDKGRSRNDTVSSLDKGISSEDATNDHSAPRSVNQQVIESSVRRYQTHSSSNTKTSVITSKEDLPMSTSQKQKQHESLKSGVISSSEFVSDLKKKSLNVTSSTISPKKQIHPLSSSTETGDRNDDQLAPSEPSPPLRYMERRHSGRWVNLYPLTSPASSNKTGVTANSYDTYIGHFKCITCGLPIFRGNDKVPSVGGYATFSSYYSNSVRLEVTVPDSFSMGASSDSYVSLMCIKCNCFIGRMSSTSAMISTSVGKGVLLSETDNTEDDDIVEANSCAIIYSRNDAPAGFETAAEREAKERDIRNDIDTKRKVNMFPSGKNDQSKNKSSVIGVAGGGVMAIRKGIDRKGVRVCYSSDDDDPSRAGRINRGRPNLLFMSPSCYSSEEEDTYDGDGIIDLDQSNKKNIEGGGDDGVDDDELWATMRKRIKS